MHSTKVRGYQIKFFDVRLTEDISQRKISKRMGSLVRAYEQLQVAAVRR